MRIWISMLPRPFLRYALPTTREWTEANQWVLFMERRRTKLWRVFLRRIWELIGILLVAPIRTQFATSQASRDLGTVWAVLERQPSPFRLIWTNSMLMRRSETCEIHRLGPRREPSRRWEERCARKKRGTFLAKMRINLAKVVGKPLTNIKVTLTRSAGRQDLQVKEIAPLNTRCDAPKVSSKRTRSSWRAKLAMSGNAFLGDFRVRTKQAQAKFM